MAYTPVEIIALIMIAIATIKIIVLMMKPMSWMNFAKKFYSNTKAIQIGSLVLGVVILYYLLQEITIVQILATTAFIGALIAMGLAPHMDLLIKRYEAQIKKGQMWKDNLIYSLIWIALLVWGAKELFF